jgi:hypothetical protein
VALLDRPPPETQRRDQLALRYLLCARRAIRPVDLASPIVISTAGLLLRRELVARYAGTPEQ